MKKNRKLTNIIFYLIATVVFTFHLAAQGAPGNHPFDRGIRFINLDNLDMLVKMLEDKTVTTELKVRTIQRMMTLFRNNPTEADKKSTAFIQSYKKAVQDHKKDSWPDEHFKLRVKVCQATGELREASVSENAVSLLKETLDNDKNMQVQIACAQSLGTFDKNKDIATDALINKLTTMLSDGVDNQQKVALASVIIGSLGKLGEKKSFIPLMKVLQSGFPMEVKKEAEHSIEKIQWNKAEG